MNALPERKSQCIEYINQYYDTMQKEKMLNKKKVEEAIKNQHSQKEMAAAVNSQSFSRPQPNMSSAVTQPSNRHHSLHARFKEKIVRQEPISSGTEYTNSIPRYEPHDQSPTPGHHLETFATKHVPQLPPPCPTAHLQENRSSAGSLAIYRTPPWHQNSNSCERSLENDYYNGTARKHEGPLCCCKPFSAPRTYYEHTPMRHSEKLDHHGDTVDLSCKPFTGTARTHYECLPVEHTHKYYGDNEDHRYLNRIDDRCHNYNEPWNHPASFGSIHQCYSAVPVHNYNVDKTNIDPFLSHTQLANFHFPPNYHFKSSNHHTKYGNHQHGSITTEWENSFIAARNERKSNSQKNR